MEYEPLDIARLWSRVDVNSMSECWEWRGGKRKGYGFLKTQIGATAAHRMAWELFHGEPLGDRLACHTCDNKSCCNPIHIYAGDHKSNGRDASDRGLLSGSGHKGERNGMAKLKEKDVKGILQMISRGRPYAEISAMYRISVSMVSRIKLGKSWKCVTEQMDQNGNET